ncbi:peptidase domain-containing ABC transporter [Salegentibacter flavus]|uniref:ABC-type bacteriocin/lantibiotic exporter, contains an N-terminal double-glycine peptidase domain n=1 Tax=Salegentibacter flavus TaxID=287099 RepID=A0A1I5B4S7_9FLAO|nr:ABC transporter ATP-binding protein [Salegentibacter flavus]SFN69693.1 ABC-type bacteriocin/lantibiotic exporter, contains an N-terminal double-glycine peptidase domain [Salegentibacter flavus]
MSKDDMTNIEKPSPLKRLLRLLKPDQSEIINIYIYSIFNGLVYLSVPLGIQAIVNLIIGGEITTSWILLIIFVVMGVAATGILRLFQFRITENLQQKIFTKAAFEFSYRLPKVRMEALYKHYVPELMNRFFDVMTVQKGLPKLLIDFSVAVLQVVFGLILLSLYHPLFIIFSVLLVFLLYIIFHFTVKKGLSTSLEESKYKYKVAHWLEEIGRNNTSFKLAGDTELPLERTNTNVDSYLKSRESHFKLLMRQYSFMVVFKVIVAASLLILGGFLVMEQTINIGQFVAAEIIILLVMESVEKLIVSLETIYDVLTGLEKIGEVTDLKLERSEGISLKDEMTSPGMKIRAEGLSFKYPGSDTNILESISFAVKRKEKFLIAGKNNSGKATLLKLIAGLYEVKEGVVSYNGISLTNLNINDMRSVIGECFAQGTLFEGTVLQNITMGRKNIPFENVKWAVNHLKLKSFIRNLPNGYDTFVEPQGYKFSRSIITKLLIARSIVSKPNLLLIEDILDNLDRQERIEIMDFLTSEEQDWTLIAVSSEAHFAKRCDQIAIVSKGRITKTGTYEELKLSEEFKNAEDA